MESFNDAKFFGILQEIDPEKQDGTSGECDDSKVNHNEVSFCWHFFTFFVFNYQGNGIDEAEKSHYDREKIGCT